MGNWKSNFIDQVSEENRVVAATGRQSSELADISGTVASNGWFAGWRY